MLAVRDGAPCDLDVECTEVQPRVADAEPSRAYPWPAASARPVAACAAHVGFDRCSGLKVLKLRIRSSDKSADLGAEALWGQETMAGLASAIVAWEMSTPVTAVAPARLNWRV